jgi:glutathione synthase/RimK-type ligase-like ATP-grasp enzyme
VSAEDLSGARLRSLAAAPVLFQEELAGRNIRVYVVGGKVAAVFEIVSEELDYRGTEVAVRVDEATGAERAACVAAAAACGMAFTGIDLRRGAGGDFAVLECNPSPMFAGIERRTGSSNPVTHALSALLAAA